MDKLDIKILRELIQSQDLPNLFLSDFRRSLRVIGKKFNVDEHTVKNRIARLRQLGLWEGWYLGPNPNLTGDITVELSFDVSSQSKGDLIPKLVLVEDVHFIRDYYGSWISVIINCESEQSLKRQIELVAGISNAENMVVARTHFPRSEISLSKTDWEIIRSMRKNPRNSYVAVAKELRLSTKTVKRRLAKMIDGKAVFAVWASNPKVFEGAILADLRVLYDNSEPRGELVQKIISQLDDFLYFVGLWDVLSVFLLIVPNVSKMQELVVWAKQQQGVKDARIDIQQERIQLWEKISDHIEKRLAQLTNV